MLGPFTVAQNIKLSGPPQLLHLKINAYELINDDSLLLNLLGKRGVSVRIIGNKTNSKLHHFSE